MRSASNEFVSILSLSHFVFVYEWWMRACLFNLNLELWQLQFLALIWPPNSRYHFCEGKKMIHVTILDKCSFFGLAALKHERKKARRRREWLNGDWCLCQYIFVVHFAKKKCINCKFGTCSEWKRTKASDSRKEKNEEEEINTKQATNDYIYRRKSESSCQTWEHSGKFIDELFESRLCGPSLFWDTYSVCSFVCKCLVIRSFRVVVSCTFHWILTPLLRNRLVLFRVSLRLRLTFVCFRCSPLTNSKGVHNRIQNETTN